MSELNKDILIQNIKQLMVNNNITQQQLAEILDMSQPNVSKALNQQDGKCFTLAQVYALAQKYNVSIDWLVGNTVAKPPARGPRAIAAFLAECIANKCAKTTTVSVEEEVFEEDYDPSLPFLSYHRTQQTITYPVLYFPNYWSVEESSTTQLEYTELFQEATQCGNETVNVQINKFINHFLEINTLYEKGEMSEEVYNMVVEDFLKRISE